MSGKEGGLSRPPSAYAASTFSIPTNGDSSSSSEWPSEGRYVSETVLRCEKCAQPQLSALYWQPR